MDTTTMIILGLVVLALIALLVWASARNKARQAEKRDELRERFGPEYDRAVQEHGSEKEAASRLGDVAKTRDKLEIASSARSSATVTRATGWRSRRPSSTRRTQRCATPTGWSGQ